MFKQIIRQTLPDLHKAIQLILDGIRIDAIERAERDARTIDLQVVYGRMEQVFDHARIADIVGELLVGRANDVFSGELV